MPKDVEKRRSLHGGVISPYSKSNIVVFIPFKFFAFKFMLTKYKKSITAIGFELVKLVHISHFGALKRYTLVFL